MEATASTRRTGLRALAWLATALYAAQLAWLAATAFAPGLREAVPGWAAALAEPGSLLAMAVTIVLGAAAFVLVLVSAPSRPSGRRIPLLISAWAAVSAAPLALAGYLPCPGDGPPVWDAISSTLSLFFGSFERPFGPGQACSYQTPLGLHVARQLALLATASGATSVLVSVSRSQLDRLALFRARRLTVIVDVDAAAWDLVDRIAAQRRPGHRTALLTSEMDPAVVERARAAGLLVVHTDPEDVLGIEEGIRPGRVERCYLLAGDDAGNRARAARIRQLLAAPARPADAGPLIVVARIDDPWHADEWRKGLIGDPLVSADAVGLYESTASGLTARLRELQPERLLVVGDGPLTLAVCAELSQYGRELEFLGEAAALPRVEVLCPHACELVEDHRVLQRRFVVDPLVVTGIDAEPTLAAVLDVLGDAERTAVLITSAGTRLGTQLGIRFPGLAVYEFSAGPAVAGQDTAAVGHLVSFGLTLVPAAGDDDAWERTARLIHERYRRRHPGLERAVAWEDLPEFYRESNRRQLQVVRRELAALGRTWRPTVTEAGGVDEARLDPDDPDSVITAGQMLLGLTSQELTRLARLEHESWQRHYLAAGWVAAPARDDGRKQHPDLVGWDELSADRRRSAIAGVVDTLLQLRALGYRAVPAETDGWHRFERIGEVTASRLRQPYRWRSPTGEELVGDPGDWLVTDPVGGTRTVADASFRASHRRLDGDRWQRTGQVQARRVRPGEPVDTQEGATTAGQQGWLVEDDGGHRWIVPPEQFLAGYRRVDADVTATTGRG